MTLSAGGMPHLTQDELNLEQRWSLRDERYRAVRGDGSGATRFPLPEGRQVEAIRLWRADEALEIGSDRFATLARSWTP